MCSSGKVQVVSRNYVVKLHRFTNKKIRSIIKASEIIRLCPRESGKPILYLTQTLTN